MKMPLLMLTAAFMAASCFAEPPAPHDSITKAYKVAGHREKLVLVALGRESCSHCRGLRKNITSGAVPIDAQEFVWADLDADNPKASAAFRERFKRVEFADVLPWVVITDSEGHVLTSWNGGKKPAFIEKKIIAARVEAARKSKQP